MAGTLKKKGLPGRTPNTFAPLIRGSGEGGGVRMYLLMSSAKAAVDRPIARVVDIRVRMLLFILMDKTKFNSLLLCALGLRGKGFLDFRLGFYNYHIFSARLGRNFHVLKFSLPDTAFDHRGVRGV